MTTQLTLVDQAKQGDPEAIASLMNRTLNQRAAHVQVRRRGGEYRLLVESEQVPDKQATVKWIGQGLKQLAIAEMQTVTIYGKARQSGKPDWQHCFQMSSQVVRLPEKTAPSPASAPSATAAEPVLDLSEHCFIRNPSLLSVNLTPPAKAVSQAVLSFAALPNAQKLAVLPLVASLLRKPEPVQNADLQAEAQAWIAEVLTLEGDDFRKLAIWLSRYCADPIATVALLSLKVAPMPSSSSGESSSAVSEGSEVSARTVVNPAIARVAAEQAAIAGQLHSPDISLLSSNSWLPVWAFPAAWALCLAIAVTLGIHSANTVEEYSSALCDLVENPSAQCKLASQLVGDDALLREVLSQDVVITPEITATAAEKCQKYSETHLLSAVTDLVLTQSSAKGTVSLANINTEEVLPGILLTDLKQIDSTGQNQPTRLACVGYVASAPSSKLSASAGELSDISANAFADASGTAFEEAPASELSEPAGQLAIQEMAVDEIPIDWPDAPYRGSAEKALSTKKALGIYNIFVSFGANTLFTAIGVFAAVMLGSCYKCYTLKGVYQLASVLGMIETLLYLIPGMGLFASVPLDVAAIGLASRFVKDFNIDWSEGYKPLARGAITIMVIRVVFSWLLYGAIAHFIL
jgi:hypothetical protein